MIVLDYLLTNTNIVDVFRLRTFHGWVGIRDGRFIYVEEGDSPPPAVGRQKLDLKGQYLAPGLVDSHMHIESSLVTPRSFAQAVVPWGTTTVLADPHEVANVAGEEGVRRMIRASEHLPLRIFFAIPSCVPATSPDLEWTAAVFDGETVERLAQEPSVIALGEVMDYRSLLAGGERLYRIVSAARQCGLRVEGHVPSLRGTEMSEYLSWQITSDHTLTNPNKIREEISKGVAVMLQPILLSRENVAAAMELPDRSHIILVTDDVEPGTLLNGHLSRVLKMAVDAGMPPLEAMAAATIRPARYLGLTDLGGIAPGYRADFMVMDDPLGFPPREVWVGGERIAGDGKWLGALPESPSVGAPVLIPGPFSASDFRLDPKARTGQVIANTVVVNSDVLYSTGLEQVPVPIEQGEAHLKEEDGLALVAVFARNRSSQTVGLVKRLGFREGAVASSFAHDSHNLLVVGHDAKEMSVAANAVYAMAGGVAVVLNGEIVASLPLPVLGLLSDAPVAEVARGFGAIEKALRGLGMMHRQPFLMFSLLSLSVSPFFKFTDKGVIDTEQRRLLPPVIWIEPGQLTQIELKK